MRPYQRPLTITVPKTLEKRFEVMQAIRVLAAQDHEQLRQRRADIAALRRELELLRDSLPALAMQVSNDIRRECGPLLRSYTQKYRPGQPRVPAGSRDGGQWTAVGVNIQAEPKVQKYSLGKTYDPEEPRVPKHYIGGGEWTREGGSTPGTSPTRGVRYAGGPYFPPSPPGYDPNTWKQGQWPNGRYWVEDPTDRNKYTAHPEDDDHWRHWDKQDSDGNNQGRWPSNSKKLKSNQTKPKSDQSLSDPNGDAPSWNPNPFVPVIPVEPIPFPDLPILPPVFVPG